MSESFGTSPVHVNSMGSSSVNSGPIDKVDPLLNNKQKRKLKDILKKKTKNDRK